MKHRFRASLALLTLALVAFAASAAPAQILPVSTPTPVPKVSLPPTESTPTPPPSGSLIKVQGQLLDVQDGFAFFTTGDGFRLASGAKIVDIDTNEPVAIANIPIRVFAAATFDGQNGQVVELDLSKKKLKEDQTYQSFDNVRRFAVVASRPAPNPELAPKQGISGKGVAVTFVVRVPPTTPLNATIYISTDQSGWDPMAIRMDRIDALHYRITQTIPSGTVFLYKYTRGTWTTQEVGRNGLQPDPHSFRVGETDAIRRDDAVYYWSDDNLSNPGGAPGGGPNGIPTPFNPRPFGFPTPR